jgi:short-subunit dehydrogenase
LDIDFLSVVIMTKILMKNMRKDGKGSVICPVGSIAGVIGSGYRTVYGGAKAALNGFF